MSQGELDVDPRNKLAQVPPRMVQASENPLPGPVAISIIFQEACAYSRTAALHIADPCSKLHDVRTELATICEESENSGESGKNDDGD